MEVELTIDNRIRVPWDGLSAECQEALRAEFEHHNPKRAALQRMGLPYRKEPPIIRTWCEDEEELSLPRGGMGRVRKVLAEHSHTWAVDDRRSEGDRHLGGIPAHRVELWEDQRAALAAFLTRQQGITRAPTGSGKTTIGFAAASAVNLPTLVIVDSKKLLNQWVKRAKKELGLEPHEVGIIQGAKRRIRSLTVAMAQTLAKCAHEYADTFGLVIFDEVQTAAAPTFMGAADPIRAKWRLGISADERRKDQKEFLIHDVFGDVIHEVDREALEDKGVVLDVEIRCVPTAFRADWYGLSEEAGDEREVDFGRLLDEMAADEDRNRLGVEIAMGEVHAGEKVLVMAHRREHCSVLASQLVARRVNAGFLIGGDDYAREFDRTLEGLLDGSQDVGVGTLQAIGKGIDLPAVGRAVVMTPIAGNRQFSGQVRGRICRAPPGKRDAVMYVLWDRECSFGWRHLKNLVAWNRSVRVLDGGSWVPARDYLRRSRPRAA